MSVVGIDFGSLHSKIGVARKRGIDIITNEVSNRQTPSLVGFGIKQRSIGESAKTQETSNFKNTVGSLKRLLGRTLNDVEIQEVEKKFTLASLVDVDGTVGAEVNYVGERHKYSATQLVAMYLGKLRDIASNELKNGVSDCVISVPGWYTDIQRRALLDAAAIAGLNPLRLINELTAVALGYGITKSDLPDAENPRHVVFVDVGHSSLSCAVVAFSKGELFVKSTAYDHRFGGRDIDRALVEHFAEEFKGKYKIDVLTNPKAIFRLSSSVEKLKKVLSANAEAPLSVESIMNDIDAYSKLTRDEYEQLIFASLEKITAPLERALEDSGLTLDQIDAVELVGGSTRIPAVRARIAAVFGGKVLSTTLNQDEACARGATFACAQISPVFKVREFAMRDITPYPITIRWEKDEGDIDDEQTLEVFPKGNNIPSTKVLSFKRKAPFDLEMVYSDSAVLPGSMAPWIAKFTAKNVGPGSDGEEFTTVKVKTRLNLHGIASFEAAYTEEVEEKDDPTAAAPMDVDGAAEGAEAAAPKKKRVVRKKDVAFVAGYSKLESSMLEQYREAEAQMFASDKLVQDTEDRKNALEEYIYDMRGKLDDRYAPYVQPSEKEALLAELAKEEDWLYTEEGEDAIKSAYVTRLDALKVLGDPITARWRETEERGRAMAELRETINTYMSQATSSEEKYAHIDEAAKQSIVEKCANVQKWLEDTHVRQTERAKNTDPVLTTAEMAKKREEIIFFATPIMTKPKPKPPKVEGTETPKSGQETPNPPPKSGQETPNPPPPTEPTEMDID